MKRAVVIGSSGALGRAIRRTLLGEFEVIGTYDTNKVDGLHKLNVTDSERVRSFFETLDYPLDALVTAHGLYHEGHSAHTHMKLFDHIMRINAGGTFNCIAAAWDCGKLKVGGSVVTISSIAAQGMYPGVAAYAASKAAIIGLTRSFAAELAPYVRVNAVSPGFVGSSGMGARMPTERQERARKSTPLQRLATPTNVADVVAFLCSDRSAHITGQVINVNGGML